MRTGTKAELLHQLETLAGNTIMEATTPSLSNTTLMIDAMVTINALVTDINIKTFGDFIDKIWERILITASKHSAGRTGFVCDQYLAISIKNTERQRRTAIGSQQIQIRRNFPYNRQSI